MNKCVEALEKAAGDLDVAIGELRKMGLASAQKKATRSANDGVITVARGNGKVALLELNSETDFVARNTNFQSLATSIAHTALQTVDGKSSGGIIDIETSTLVSATLHGTASPVSEAVGVAISQLGENIVVRRSCVLLPSPAGGVVCNYVHNAYSPDVGRAAAAVAITSRATDKKALNRQS